MIRFACPSCAKSISAPEDAAGRHAKCPGCGQRLTIPAAAVVTVKPVAPDRSSPAAPVASRPGPSDVVPKQQAIKAVRPQTAARKAPLVPTVYPTSDKPKAFPRIAIITGVLLAVFGGGAVLALGLSRMLGGKEEKGPVASATLPAAKQTEAETPKPAPVLARGSTTSVSSSVAIKAPEPKPAPVVNPVQAAEVKPPAQVEKTEPAVPETRGPLPPTIVPETVRKVKRATAYLKVMRGDGATAEGSGFFAVQPGIVVTNAHVVGMLSASADRPRRVEVVVNHGDQGEMRLAGAVLGVDRQSDLAIVRVSGDPASLPPPLPVDLDMEALTELQPVYIFGFPLGTSLGKEITVMQANIASFRKETDGSLYQIQLNGGMQPGNSGGPVVDSRGVVIGVAVAGVRGTTINFAVPGDKIHGMLHGKVLGTQLGARFRDQQDVKIPITIAFLDPLQRVREVKLGYWTGPPGKVPPSTLKTPTPLPGDGPAQSVAMTYQQGLARQDVVLPTLPPGHLYWLRTEFVDQDGLRQWGPAVLYKPSEGAPLDRVPASLVVNASSQQRSLKLLSRSKFQITQGKNKLVDTSEADLQTLEILTKNPKGAGVKLVLGKSAFYDVDGRRKVLRNPVAQNAVRTAVYDYQVDPGGRLTSFGFVTFNLRDPATAAQANAMSADVTTTYQGVCLGMPNRQVAAQETWQEKIRMLFGEQKKKKDVYDVVLTCRYEGSRKAGESTEALILLSGEVKLVNQPPGGLFRKPRERVNGVATFDVTRGFLSHLQLAMYLEVELEGAILSRTVEINLARTAGNVFGISPPSAAPGRPAGTNKKS